jgi:PAS domain S-box-containing protein
VADLHHRPENRPVPLRGQHVQSILYGDERIASALWADHVGFWTVYIDLDQVHWSNDWCQRLDLDPCEGPGHLECWNARVHPDDLAGTASYELLLQGQSRLYSAEYRLRTLAGEWRWVMSRGCVAEADSFGRPTVIVGITVDIDARKRAELALRESEDRLALAVWGGELGLWDWNVVTDRCSWLNDWPAGMDFDACTSTEHAQRWNEKCHPDDRRHIALIDAECHEGQRDAYEYEYRHRTEDGRWRWLFERGRVVARGRNGRAIRIAGVSMDITRLKDQERALREVRERYLAVVERVPGYVFEMRPSEDGLAKVTWASDGLEDVFGCNLEEYTRLGGWRRFWSPQDVARNEDNMRTLRTGQATEQEWRVHNLRGEECWLHAFYTPFCHAAEGQVDLILGVAHDVTERVLLERQVLEASQQEQQRIASDLHDGLGQELTGIAMTLQSIIPRLKGVLPAEAKVLAEAVGLVRTAISSTRAIAHGIAPVSDAPGALPAALQQLANDVSNLNARAVSLTVTGDIQRRLPVELATQLYRIAQEAVNLAVRRSQANRIEIELHLENPGGRLSIRHNGRHQPAEGDSKGLGLRMLAYRAQMIGAKLEIRPQEPRGTAIACDFSAA